MALIPEGAGTVLPTPVHLAGGGKAQTASVMSSGILDLYSDHMLLMSLEDHQTILSFQSSEEIYPASLTKIMTAIIAIEALDDFDETVTVSPALLKSLAGKKCLCGRFPAWRAGLRQGFALWDAAALRGGRRCYPGM